MTERFVLEPGGDDLGQAESELAERLLRERPVPMAGFRGALARRLAAHDPGYGPRPPHIRTTVGLYTVAGLLALLAGTLQATGLL